MGIDKTGQFTVFGTEYNVDGSARNSIRAFESAIRDVEMSHSLPISKISSDSVSRYGYAKHRSEYPAFIEKSFARNHQCETCSRDSNAEIFSVNFAIFYWWCVFLLAIIAGILILLEQK